MTEINRSPGTKVTTIAPLATGGTGIIGWLSQIWDKLNGTVAVSSPVTDAQLRAAAVPVSGPLTDAQLRATQLPVDHGTKVTAVPALGAGGTGVIGWLDSISSACAIFSIDSPT